MDWLERERRLIGSEAVEKIAASRILIFGIGGVGSYTAEAGARAGAGSMLLIDKDTVDVTNINRQLMANRTTVGLYKTYVMRERIRSINPDCDVRVSECFVGADNAAAILDVYRPTYVADCIDNVTGKLAIIEGCKERNIPVISCMGTGNKMDPSRFMISDISKTSVCPLARVMRRELKQRGIHHVDVLWSDELPHRDGERSPASISFVPSSAGLLIASHMIRKIIGDL